MNVKISRVETAQCVFLFMILHEVAKTKNMEIFSVVGMYIFTLIAILHIIGIIEEK